MYEYVMNSLIIFEIIMCYTYYYDMNEFYLLKSEV